MLYAFGARAVSCAELDNNSTTALVGAELELFSCCLASGIGPITPWSVVSMSDGEEEGVRTESVRCVASDSERARVEVFFWPDAMEIEKENWSTREKCNCNHQQSTSGTVISPHNRVEWV